MPSLLTSVDKAFIRCARTHTLGKILLCLLVHMQTHMQLKEEDECAGVDNISPNAIFEEKY